MDQMVECPEAWDGDSAIVLAPELFFAGFRIHKQHIAIQLIPAPHVGKQAGLCEEAVSHFRARQRIFSGGAWKRLKEEACRFR